VRERTIRRNEEGEQGKAPVVVQKKREREREKTKERERELFHLKKYI
jgi:hypothetical protein